MKALNRMYVLTATRVALFVIGFGVLLASTSDMGQGDAALLGAGLFVVCIEVVLDAVVCWMQGDRGRTLAGSVAANVGAWVAAAAALAGFTLWANQSTSSMTTFGLLALAVGATLATSTWSPPTQALSAFIILGLVAPALISMGVMDFGVLGAIAAYALWLVAIGPLAAWCRTTWPRRRAFERSESLRVTVILAVFAFACTVSLSAVFVSSYYIAALAEISTPEPTLTSSALRNMAEDYSRNVTASQALAGDRDAIDQLSRLAAVSGVSLTILDNSTRQVVLAVRPVSRDSSGRIMNDDADTPPPPTRTAIESGLIAQGELTAITAGLESHRHTIAVPMALPAAITRPAVLKADTPSGYQLTDRSVPANASLLLVASPQEADWWTLPDSSPSEWALQVVGWIGPLLVLTLLVPAAWALRWSSRAERVGGGSVALEQESLSGGSARPATA